MKWQSRVRARVCRPWILHPTLAVPLQLKQWKSRTDYCEAPSLAWWCTVVPLSVRALFHCSLLV